MSNMIILNKVTYIIVGILSVLQADSQSKFDYRADIL